MYMYEARYIESVPLFAITATCMAIVILSIQAGLWIARYRRRAVDASQDGPIGSAVGATLGLLAFMLAFTFGIAASRREAKRDLLLQEVNAIGTTYLRADIIPEAHRGDVRKLLRDYVDLRLTPPNTVEDYGDVIQKSNEIQKKLWTHAAALASEDLKNPDICSLFVDSTNEMFDLQTSRVVVGYYTYIPSIIWVALGGLTVISMMAVGYQFGRSGRGNWLVALTLAVSFSLVVTLICDLDRVRSGFLTISTQPMKNLRASMNE